MISRSCLVVAAVVAALGVAPFAAAQPAREASVPPATAGYDPCVGRVDGPCAFPRFDASRVVAGTNFSVPGVDQNNTLINYGGSAVGVSEDGKYLYVSCRQDANGQAARGKLAKIEIPAPGGVGRVVQACQGLSMTDLAKIHPDPNAYTPYLGGVLEMGGRLILDAYISYDAAGTTSRSHWKGTSLTSMAGPFSGTVSPGLVKSYMGVIPPEWRTMLGGDAYATAGYMSIISRSSYGAAFTVFNSADVSRDQFPMKMLLGCPHSVSSCITWGTPQSLWLYNGSEQSGGALIVPGTRTLYVVEREALGPTCYGYATRNQADHGKPYLDAVYCYSLSDPLDQKGPMGYPYQLVAKLYDLAELVDVKLGKKQPWDVKPYDVVAMPGSKPNDFIGYTGGGAFNTVTGEYYLTRELYPGNNNNATVTVYAGFPKSNPSGQYEICGDGIDNDGDGQVDEGCTAEICGDGIDNDGDGQIDEGCSTTEVCGDGIDNDGDGQIDEGCAQEICGDGLDNDGDGQIDEGCAEKPTEICGDGKDNDGDGRIDEECESEGAAPGSPRRLYGLVSRQTVALRWTAPLTGGAVKDYVLEAGVSPGTTFLSTSVGLTTTLTVPNVGVGRYYVRIRASNENGVSAPSNEVVLSVGCRNRPGRPESLTSASRGGLVTITWRDPDGCSGTKYRVDVASSSGGVQAMATDEPSATALLTPGTYLARVTAGSDTGVSDPAELQFTVANGACSTPRFHTTLRTVVAGRRVGLFWSPLDPEIAAADDQLAPVSYVIEAGSAPGVSDLVVAPFGRLSQLITDVPPGTYYVRIRPSNACGGGTASNEAKLVVR